MYSPLDPSPTNTNTPSSSLHTRQSGVAHSVPPGFPPRSSAPTQITESRTSVPAPNGVDSTLRRHRGNRTLLHRRSLICTYIAIAHTLWTADWWTQCRVESCTIQIDIGLRLCFCVWAQTIIGDISSCFILRFSNRCCRCLFDAMNPDLFGATVSNPRTTRSPFVF